VSDTDNAGMGTATVESTTVTPSGQGGEGSAPLQETPTGAGQPVEAAEGGKTEPNQLPQETYLKIRREREAKRYQRQMEQRMEQLERQLQQNAGVAPAAPKQIWDDPDAYLEQKFQSYAERQQSQIARSAALEYVQSQSDVRSEDDEDEIADVMREFGLHLAVSHNPKKAAELALQIWRQRRGINPAADAAKQTQLSKERAKGVVGAPASGGAKIWTKAEVAELGADPKRWAEVREEIMQASKEGRVR